jgi:hypothetical protein
MLKGRRVVGLVVVEGVVIEVVCWFVEGGGYFTFDATHLNTTKNE